MNSENIGDIVLNTEQISQGVSVVANRLNDQFGNQSAVIITVVPGGILFTADLVRGLDFDVSMDTVSCPHVPGERNNRSPIVYHQNIPINDQVVIVVDDAIESGGTMKRIIDYLTEHHRPRSLAIATLLVKPGRVQIPAEQYFAYEMENDDLLVGYGLPWNDTYRNLPFVAKLIK